MKTLTIGNSEEDSDWIKKVRWTNLAGDPVKIEGIKKALQRI